MEMMRKTIGIFLGLGTNFVFNWNNFGLNRFGREKKTNRTEINQFDLVFGSVRFKISFKKISLIVYFGPKLDRTENAQPS